MAEIRLVLICIVLFGLVVGGFAMIHGELITNYNQESRTIYNPQLQQIESGMNETKYLAINISDEMGSIDTTATSGWESLVSGTYGAMRMTLRSFNYVRMTTNAVASIFGIPNWVMDTIVAMILIVIITAIMSVIFRRNV